MKLANQDSLAFGALEWAFSGKRVMPLRQHHQVKAVAREAKLENYESAGKRRSRFWGLGPAWARKAA